MFKEDSAFYDYTPFKIFQGTWGAAGITVTNPLSNPPTYVNNTLFNFGWCQVLDEALDAACTGDFYAGSFPPPED